MSIKIKYEKVLRNNEARISVLEISALRHSELPKEYTEGYPRAWKSNESLYMKMSEESILRILRPIIYTKEEFSSLVEEIVKCGERLAGINRKLREENRNWKGVHTLEI